MKAISLGSCKCSVESKGRSKEVLHLRTYILLMNSFWYLCITQMTCRSSGYGKTRQFISSLEHFLIEEDPEQRSLKGSLCPPPRTFTLLPNGVWRRRKPFRKLSPHTLFWSSFSKLTEIKWQHSKAEERKGKSIYEPIFWFNLLYGAGIGFDGTFSVKRSSPSFAVSSGADNICLFCQDFPCCDFTYLCTNYWL